MTTRTCRKCGASKPLTDYYAHPCGKDGFDTKCKACAKLDARKRQFLKHEEIAAYERKRAADPARRAKAVEYQRARRLRHPEKAYAHAAVSYALKSGKLTRKPCEICGELKVQAHHNDYRFPLAVRWFCFRHHRTVGHSQKIAA